MSGYKKGEAVGLFDPITGAYVGVIDANGGEMMLPAVPGGTTAQRPAAPVIGQPYYDATLNLPIWCKSLGPVVWINSAGATV